MEACIPAIFFLLFSQAADFEKNMAYYKTQALNFFISGVIGIRSEHYNFVLKVLKQSDSLRKACKAEILAAILFQCCVQGSEKDKARVEFILPLLMQPDYETILQNYVKSYCYRDYSEEGKNFLRLLKSYGYTG